MSQYKLYFFVNVVIIVIESITIYLYEGGFGWLLIMLSAMALEVITVIMAKRSKSKKELLNKE